MGGVSGVRHSRTVWGWALYDWANSAFATTVMAGFFPIFFKQYWSAGQDPVGSTAVLGLGNSIASLCVAVLAPVIGALADAGSARKRLLMVFAYSGALCTASLYWIPVGGQLAAITVYGLAVICFSAANVGYDSLLITVSDPANRDRISALGYSMGYLGGGLLFSINVAMAMRPHWFGLSDAAQAVRYSFLSVALWWAGFSLFTARWVPSDASTAPMSWRRSVHEGLVRMKGTIAQVLKDRSARLFLLAYWCYMDGVDTIIRMAVDYGLSIGFESRDLILALLLVQFIGFPAALLFGRLSHSIGERKSIHVAILGYMAATVWGCMMQEKMDFYLLAAWIGCIQGGIQALSRSYFARFIPAGWSAGYYGLMNMTGKMAAIVGPALVAGVAVLARNLLITSHTLPEEMTGIGQIASRVGMGSILLLFVAGFMLLSRVREPSGPRGTLDGDGKDR